MDATGGRRAPLPRGSETVVVVDDEALVRGLVGAILRSFGYHVIEMDNAHEALQYAAMNAKGIHLLVSDIIMPGTNGVELHTQLQKKVPHLKVLFMSGHSQHVLEDLGFRIPSGHFVSKPFPMEQLARKVREILDG